MKKVITIFLKVIGVLFLLGMAVSVPFVGIPATIGLVCFTYKHKAKNKVADSDNRITRANSSGSVQERAEQEVEKDAGLRIEATYSGFEQTFTTRVAGVTYNNPDGTSRQKIIAGSKPGQPVVLVREKDNPKDKYAIAVYDKKRRMLGYIPAGDARLASHMDRGGKVKATIKSKGKRGNNYGLVLEIVKGDFDWKFIKPYMDKDKQIREIIEETRSLEKEDPQKAIDMYEKVIAEIIELDNMGDIAKAWRTSRIPIDRLTLLLERTNKPREALEYIQWYNNYNDYAGLTTSALEMIQKREKRLEAKTS